MRRNSDKIAALFAILFFVIVMPSKAQESQVIDRVVSVWEFWVNKGRDRNLKNFCEKLLKIG